MFLMGSTIDPVIVVYSFVAEGGGLICGKKSHEKVDKIGVEGLVQGSIMFIAVDVR